MTTKPDMTRWEAKQIAGFEATSPRPATCGDLLGYAAREHSLTTAMLHMPDVHAKLLDAYNDGFMREFREVYTTDYTELLRIEVVA